MHSYKPTDIYFDSACGDTTKSVTCTLFNINVDSQKLIDYIKPHPRIKWVEELNRDRNFCHRSGTFISYCVQSKLYQQNATRIDKRSS